MRSSVPALLWCLLATLFGFPGLAQEQTQSPQSPSSTEGENDSHISRPAPDPAPNVEPQAPPATRFTPSEEIDADDAVSFPVDI